MADCRRLPNRVWRGVTLIVNPLFLLTLATTSDAARAQVQSMMTGGNMMNPMMWGMAIFWLLFVILLVLGIAALIKYIFKR